MGAAEGPGTAHGGTTVTLQEIQTLFNLSPTDDFGWDIAADYLDDQGEHRLAMAFRAGFDAGGYHEVTGREEGDRSAFGNGGGCGGGIGDGSGNRYEVGSGKCQGSGFGVGRGHGNGSGEGDGGSLGERGVHASGSFSGCGYGNGTWRDPNEPQGHSNSV
jgi:hypothetical protein